MSTNSTNPASDPSQAPQDLTLKSPSSIGRGGTSPATFERAIEALPPDHQDTLRRVYYIQREQRWTNQELAKRLRRDATAISKVWNGSFDGRLDRFLTDCAQFLDDWATRAGVGNPRFIQTEVAKLLTFAADKAAATRTVAIAYGPMGIGKTEWADEYHRTHNHGKTIYFRIPPGLSEGHFVQAFARSIGEASRTHNTGELKAKIRDNIAKRARLVIIDEAHEPFLTIRADLPIRIFEFLRWIHDETRVGLLLIGTDVLPAEMRSGRFSKALGQITDRGNINIQLPAKPTAEDLRAFYRHYKLPVPDGPAKALVRDILHVHSLRRLVFHLQDGERAALKTSQPYTWAVFIQAHDLMSQLATA